METQLRYEEARGIDLGGECSSARLDLVYVRAHLVLTRLDVIVQYITLKVIVPCKC